MDPTFRHRLNGARQGRNDFRKIGYGGPCPPPGKPHRYFFKLYALDKKLDLSAGASKAETESTMKGHILAQAELMGRYCRLVPTLPRISALIRQSPLLTLFITEIFICPLLFGIVGPPRRWASYVPSLISGFDLRSPPGN